jgi:dimethylaniline monooxygenase (N-oxide forming)
MQNLDFPDGRVAVIGGGPAGLVVAHWLKRYGLDPCVFEAADALGGQWNPRSPGSATWAGMRTNTSRTMSCFSDLPHDPAVAVFPARGDMQAYLERYAATFDLIRHIRFGARIDGIARDGAGWRVASRTQDGGDAETFSRIVVATGAEGVPLIPRIAGLERFTGAIGVLHSRHYDGVERFRGRRVVVAGCSISALEIASDLAFGGAAEVIVSNRRQRYVLPKLIGGVPTDNVMFTRAAALAEAALPPEALAAQIKAQIVRAGGDPVPHGGPAPDANPFVAGLTQAQHFLPAVAEGRIAIRPWIERVDGSEVRFADGSSAEPDAMIFGTGYAPAFDCLAADVAALLGAEKDGLDLCGHSFHPDLPGLAFVGLYNVVGPKLPVLELQARWVAAILAGRAETPSPGQMRAEMAVARDHRLTGRQPTLHGLALDFAGRLGVDPDPANWPGLARTLLFGPLTPSVFRLEGPDRDVGAAERVRAEAATFGAITTPDFTADELALCGMLDQRLRRDGAEPAQAELAA